MKFKILIIVIFIGCGNDRTFISKIDLRVQQYNGVFKVSVPCDIMISCNNYFFHSDYNRSISLNYDYKIKYLNDTLKVCIETTIDLEDSIIEDSTIYEKILINLQDKSDRNTLFENIINGKKAILEGDLWVLNYNYGFGAYYISERTLTGIFVLNLKDEKLKNDIINSIQMTKNKKELFN
jgi:hypothetical protein